MTLCIFMLLGLLPLTVLLAYTVHDLVSACQLNPSTK